MQNISKKSNTGTTEGQNLKKPSTFKLVSVKNLLLIFAIFFSISSCKKAVETFNMIGTWEVVSYSENGVDRTTYFKNTFVDYRIKFDVAKTFLETSKVANVDITNGGSWKVLSGGGSLELTYFSDSTVRVLELVNVKRNSSTIREGEKEFNLLKL
jgi:hypothetical protein